MEVIIFNFHIFQIVVRSFIFILSHKYANSPFQKYSFLVYICKTYIMTQTKREQVISHIRYLRQELREMHLGIKEDDLFPEPGELRGLMAQLEALLELIEGNTKIQSNSEAA